MTEHFDDFMAGLLETAAANAAPGPVAARRRARQRRTRKRLAVSALALVLLTGAGSIAAANLGHDNGSQIPVGQKDTPTPSASSASAPASPSAVATTLTPSANPSTSSNTAASLVPGVYNPGDWYNATDVPLASQSIAWVPGSDMYGTRIGGNVSEVQSSGSDISELASFGDLCQIPGLANGTTATEYEYYTGANNNGYLNTADTAIAANATHLVYFYPDSTSASAAWNAIASGFTNCAGHETGVDPSTGVNLTGAATRTTSAVGTQCWSNVTTPTDNSKGSGTLDHACFLQQGNVIAAVDISVNFEKSAYVSTIDYNAFDSTMFHDLSAGLSGSLYTGSHPVCASGDLKVTLGPSGTYNISGSQYRILVVKNISGSTCTVEGYPVAMLVDGAEKILTTAENDPQNPYTAKHYSEAQITLAPDAASSAIMSWSSSADSGTCSNAGAHALVVFAPYAASATSLGTLSNVCDGLTITPIQSGVVAP